MLKQKPVRRNTQLIGTVFARDAVRPGAGARPQRSALQAAVAAGSDNYAFYQVQQMDSSLTFWNLMVSFLLGLAQEITS